MPTKDEALKALKDLVGVPPDCTCDGCVETRRLIQTIKSYLEGDKCPEQPEESSESESSS